MTEDNVSFGRLVPMLTTDDLDGTIAFYRDTLGFEVAGTYPEDNPNWCYLKRGDSHLMFSTLHKLDHDHDEHGHDHDEHSHDHDEHGHDEGEGYHHDSPTGVWTLYVYPDDVDSLWEKLKGQARVAYPLHETPYGMREFGIRDPNGYTLSFGKEI